VHCAQNSKTCTILHKSLSAKSALSAAGNLEGAPQEGRKEHVCVGPAEREMAAERGVHRKLSTRVADQEEEVSAETRKIQDLQEQIASLEGTVRASSEGDWFFQGCFNAEIRGVRQAQSGLEIDRMCVSPIRAMPALIHSAEFQARRQVRVDRNPMSRIRCGDELPSPDC
jgi:hypothetical protein